MSIAVLAFLRRSRRTQQCIISYTHRFTLVLCFVFVCLELQSLFDRDVVQGTLDARYRLVQIERPKMCPRLMTNAIPNQYAQIWYRRKAREKIKRVAWLDFRVRR